jgi:Zn-dependent protease with chaperone function
MLWSFLILALAVRWGIGSRLRAWAETRTRRFLVQTIMVYTGIALWIFVWATPASLINILIERGYGFYTGSFARWMADRGISLAYSMANALAVWVCYLIVRRSPRRWWLWMWALAAPWVLVSTALYPVVVAPAFHEFTPMQPSPLRDRILSLAAQAGLSHPDVLIANTSSRTTRINAYVAGLGPTQRIVIWDTALKELPPNELVAVLGHEIGHYRLGHLWWIVIGGVAGAGALLWLLSRMLPRAIRRFGEQQGVRDIGDLAGLPIALFVLQILMVAQQPVESAISRIHERQADAYGVRITHDPMSAAQVMVRFAKRDYADPDPPAFLVWWFYSHPPVRERIEAILNDKEQSTGINLRER